MKAVCQAGYGGAEQLSVQEVPLPKLEASSVLVRIVAVSVNAGDHHMLT